MLDTHFTVHVNYDPFPTKEQLNKSLFDEGEEFLLENWEAHLSCPTVDEAPKDVTFHLLDMPDIRHQSEFVQNTLTAGYRYATLKEGLAFAFSHPDFQRGQTIEIHGSRVESKWFALLVGTATKRRLWIHHEFFAYERGHAVLLVKI